MEQKTITTSTHEFTELWTLLFPDSEPPSQPQITYWIAKHGTSIVREAFLELAIKHRNMNGKMDADHMGRFASKVMGRLTLQEKSNVPVPRTTVAAKGENL